MPVMMILKAIWAFLVKDFLAGVLLATLKDMAKKFIEKTPWSVILERFITRLGVMCLKWLASMTTNKLALATVNDFLEVLQGHGLREARPLTDPMKMQKDASHEKDEKNDNRHRSDEQTE